MAVIHTQNELLVKQKHVAKIISNEKAEVLHIQLRSGETIPEHNSPYPVMIIVREGKIDFSVEGTTYPLQNDTVLTLEPLENHSLVAVEDADVLVIKVK